VSHCICISCEVRKLHSFAGYYTLITGCAWLCGRSGWASFNHELHLQLMEMHSSCFLSFIHLLHLYLKCRETETLVTNLTVYLGSCLSLHFSVGSWVYHGFIQTPQTGICQTSSDENYWVELARIANSITDPLSCMLFLKTVPVKVNSTGHYNVTLEFSLT